MNKTFLSAIGGVAFAAISLSVFAGMSRADSVTPQSTSSPASKVSFASSLPALASSAQTDAVSRFSELTDYSQSPIAAVVSSSIRRTSQGGYLAKRSDGNVCLEQRYTGTCYSAFEAGGIATSVTEIRMWDSPTAPFQVVIDGIAQDGVKAVTFQLNDGTAVVAQVTGNAFSATIPKHSASDLAGYEVATGTANQSYAYSQERFPPYKPLKIVK